VTDSAARAEDAAQEHWSRRALVGAGVVGAVLVATGSRPAAAGSAPLSAEDRAFAAFAIGIELSARNLYQAAIDAGAEGTAWAIFANSHASYAERIAGITGIPANTADPGLFAEREADFTGDRPANAAFSLENSLIATHVDLLAQVTDPDIADALASILAMESSHAAYLAERSGRGDNFDALFNNDATPITPAVGQ
jgi:hypothetical protein